MQEPKESVVRIELTEAQKQQIREVTGKQLDAVELNVDVLEERIAPRRANPLL